MYIETISPVGLAAAAKRKRDRERGFAARPYISQDQRELEWLCDRPAPLNTYPSLDIDLLGDKGGHF